MKVEPRRKLGKHHKPTLSNYYILASVENLELEKTDFCRIQKIGALESFEAQKVLKLSFDLVANMYF